MKHWTKTSTKFSPITLKMLISGDQYNLRLKTNCKIYNPLKKLTIKKILYIQMKCCGINGPDDWTNELNTLILPTSCCPNLTNSTSSEMDCIKENASQNGCKTILMDHMKYLTTILAGVGVGIGWLQV